MKTSAVRTVLRIAALCLSLLALPVAARAQAGMPGWTVDLAPALAKAKAEHKLLLLYFTGSDWCPLCVDMDKEVYSTPEFQKYAQANLVLVELDFPHKKQQSPAIKQQNEIQYKKYDIDGRFPTTIVLGPDGGTRKVLVGYDPGSGPAEYIALFEKLKATDGPQ